LGLQGCDRHGGNGKRTPDRWGPDAGGPGRDTIRAFIGTLGSNTVEALWQVPTCTGTSAALQSSMYPLDQGWRRVNINGTTGATVTQVCQDEPPNFENVPAWAVDADGVGTSAVSVRAQRSGTRTAPGNGRVYHIYFTASSCSGKATIGVPTVANGTATDEGPLYNSVTGAACVVPGIPTVTVAPSFVETSSGALIATAPAATDWSARSDVPAVFEIVDGIRCTPHR